MSSTRFEMPEKTVEKIGGVLAGHPEVEKAILYGSRAKGNYRMEELYGAESPPANSFSVPAALRWPVTPKRRPTSGNLTA